MSEVARQRQSRIDDLMSPEHKYDGEIPSGFVENWQASLAVDIDQHMTMSRFIGESSRRDRNSAIEEAITKGDIPHEVVSTFVHRPRRDIYGKSDWDYDGLAEWGNERGMNFETGEKLDEERDAGIRVRMRMQQEIAEKAGWQGVAGQFAGSLHAGAIDPPMALASLFSLGQASTIWQAFKTGAKFNVVLETLAQPAVFSWKEEIGIDYTYANAFNNVALSALFGGTMSGSFKAIGKAIEQFQSMKVAAIEDGDLEAAAALAASIDSFKQAQTEANHAPDQTVPHSTADRAIGDAYVAANESTYTPESIKAEAELEGHDKGDANYREKVEEEVEEIESFVVDPITGKQKFAEDIKVAEEVEPGKFEYKSKQEVLEPTPEPKKPEITPASTMVDDALKVSDDLFEKEWKAILNRGDRDAFPWLTADGRVIATMGDHMTLPKAMGFTNLVDTMEATGAALVGFHKAEDGSLVTIQSLDRITPEQAAKVKEWAEKNEAEVKISIIDDAFEDLADPHYVTLLTDDIDDYATLAKPAKPAPKEKPKEEVELINEADLLEGTEKVPLDSAERDIWVKGQYDVLGQHEARMNMPMYDGKSLIDHILEIDGDAFELNVFRNCRKGGGK